MPFVPTVSLKFFQNIIHTILLGHIGRDTTTYLIKLHYGVHEKACTVVIVDFKAFMQDDIRDDGPKATGAQVIGPRDQSGQNFCVGLIPWA